jgi:hypothetical protein
MVDLGRYFQRDAGPFGDLYGPIWPLFRRYTTQES